jgi:hypothetical protein
MIEDPSGAREPSIDASEASFTVFVSSLMDDRMEPWRTEAALALDSIRNVRKWMFE